ncbi:aminopeptidase [Acetivibrio clariflavus]|uniref:aminopeptidase n=1 Tax=Acetivibrio clariflavus TaxID=288965 RepID=UPI0031F4BF92
MENYLSIIPNLVSGFEIKRGSAVLLNFWGENRDLVVLDKFAIEIAKVGGIPIRWQQSRELMKTYFMEVSQEYLDFPDVYVKVFKLADVVIDIFMYSPTPQKEFPQEKLLLYSNYIRKMFGALIDGKAQFIQVRVPTEENAASIGIDFEIFKEEMYSALNIDFQKLKEKTTNLVRKLDNKNRINVFTGDNYVLSFNVENRKWHKDDGTGDIPCGEIYIAPVEESAEGKILIPQVMFEGEKLFKVLLEFKEGKLVNCSSKKLFEHIKQLSGDSNKFAEFGIGLNENIRKLTGYALFDEKCAGTAHIAIGMNELFGGKNSSQFHMDFIFIPVRIEVDGKSLMEGSKLVL